MTWGGGGVKYFKVRSTQCQHAHNNFLTSNTFYDFLWLGSPWGCSSLSDCLCSAAAGAAGDAVILYKAFHFMMDGSVRHGTVQE